MKWTAEKPTEAGFYWWRSVSGDIELIEVDAVGSVLCFGSELLHPIATFHGEFAGPLVPPD